MVLIPEEICPEEDEMGSSEWRESEVEYGYPWCGFDTFYNKYCERMLFFDKMSAQQLKEIGSWNISSRSPRKTTKKLASTLRNLSFKSRDELQEDCEQLQQSPEEDPSHNLETAYAAQICLAWEALHCQYTQLNQKISSQLGIPPLTAMLLRPFSNSWFSCRGLDQKENAGDNLDAPVLGSDLLKIMEDSILTFRLFLKMDKKKSNHSLNLFKGHNQDASSLHQIQASLVKKEIKEKELSKKKKSWKKKSRPSSPSEVELLLGLIDIKVVSRVLRMARISKEQLLWCEEKMSKINLSENKLGRDGSPILFPLLTYNGMWQLAACFR